MTSDSSREGEMLDRMRAGDPLRAASAPDVDVDTDTALRLVLARVADEPAPSRARSATRRRALRLGAVGVAAGVATMVVINVASVGHGDVERSLTRSGIGVAPVRAATLARRVRRALAVPPGQILEVENVITGRKSSSDPSSSETVHYWEQDGAPHDQVIEATVAGRTSVTGEHDGQLEYYDPSSDTISIMTPTPAVEAAEGTSPRGQALALMRRRGVRIDREARFDGAPAIRLTSTEDRVTTTMYLAPDTYVPLEYRTDALPSAPADERGGSVVMRYTVYRTLTGAQATPALVSLTVQHPSATVIHQGPTAWNAAEAKLAP